METAAPKDARKDYRNHVNQMGKKEFTFLKMQEYGFWPEGLPTPYERQKNETKEEYRKRKELLEEYEQMAKQIADLYEEKKDIMRKLLELRREYDETWDSDKIRKEIAKQIMQESIKRRMERKKQREQQKAEKTESWKKKKAETIVFIGKGYSGLLSDRKSDNEKLASLGLPIIEGEKELADLLAIEMKELRFLTYHRDVVTADHYYRYCIPKRNGGERNIAAPKPVLKKVQKKILEEILEKIETAEQAHGFLKGKSVISSADRHMGQPWLLINMDIENFFPTVTFARVRGMFHSFGYSGYISSLLAMLCTYCERMPIEVNGHIKYVKTSERILPQGSPASPMITNIICKKLDEKLDALSKKYAFVYTRYADDMSFSFREPIEREQIKKIIFLVQSAVYSQGFRIHKQKTRCLKRNSRQCITGIVVNGIQLGVPKKWVKRMRAAVYNAKKAKNEGKLSPEVMCELSGMASWLQAVNAQRYEEFIQDVIQLADS